jgi:hypothetical protein
LSTGLLTASNISANSISTNYGFFSTISAGLISAKFAGDASGLTNIPNNGAVLTVSNIAVSGSNAGVTNAGNITTLNSLVNNISTNVTTISTNLNTVSNYLITVSSIAISGSNAGVTNATNITTVSNLVIAGRFAYISTNTLSTSQINSSNISNAGNISTNTLNVGQGTFSSIISPQAYISSLVVDQFTIGFSTGYISMPDLLVNTISSQLINVGILNALTISTNFIYGQFIGDGSQLTGISGGGGSSAVPPFLSTNTLSTNTLTASNISTNSISTNYGFFSTISAGTITAKFVGDGSGLTGISGTVTTALPPILSTTLLSTNLLTAANVSTNSLSEKSIRFKLLFFKQKS